MSDAGVGGFLPPVVALLLADIKGFKAGMDEADAKMAESSGMFTKLGGLGKAALLGVGAAAIAVGAYSVHMASQFDAAMELVHTQAGASQREVDSLRGSVLALAGPTAQTPLALAQALYHVESAGFRGATALSMVHMAAEGATIGQANLESVTQAMIGTMAAGLPDVHNAAQAMQYMNDIVGTGDMRMEKLAQSIATGVLPTFKTAGLTMKDYGAALATLTDNVTPADEAATRLRMTIALMAAPSKAAVGSLEKIGLSATSLGMDMRKPNGLLLAVEDLKKHLEATYPTSGRMVLNLKDQAAAVDRYRQSLLAQGDTQKSAGDAAKAYAADLAKGMSLGAAMNLELQKQVITHAFGGGRSSGAIQTLLVEIDRLKSKYDFLGDGTQRAARFQDAWAATQAQFAVKVEQVKTTVEALAVQIGHALIPYLITAATWFINAAQWVMHNHTAMLALGAVIGTVLVAGLVAATGAAIAFGAALVTDPIFLVVAGIAALVVGIKYAYDNFGWFHTAVTKVWAALQDGLHWLEAHKALLIAIGLVIAGPFIASFLLARLAIGWLVTAFQHVSAWIASWLGPFIGWWQSRWGEIAAVLHFVWGLISTYVGVGITIVTLLIKNALAVLVPIFKVAWDIIVGIVKIAWALIGGAVKIAWDILSGIVRTGFQVIRSIFEVALDLLTGHWKQAWTDLVAGFYRIFSTIYDTARTVMGTLGQTIVTAAKDFGSLLLQAGKDLITGLINGVKNMAGAATDAVKNVGSGILSGVKSMFGIKSPSTVFHGYGVNLMQGLANGINASKGLPTTALGGIFSGNPLQFGPSHPFGWSHLGGGGLNLGGVGGSSWMGHIVESLLAGAYTGGVGSGGFRGLGALVGAGGRSYAAAPSSSLGGGWGRNPEGPPIQVFVDGTHLFTIMQNHALQNGNRNLSNGLTPVARTNGPSGTRTSPR